MAFLTVQTFATDRMNFAPDSARLVEASVGTGLVGGQRLASGRAPGRRAGTGQQDYTSARAAAYAEDGEIRRGMYIDRFI
jgi:hypothetical protein